MSPLHPIDLFDKQFRRQIEQQEFALNPFEQLALEHVRGRVLDLGCGLGNLALEAARRGCEVTAVDGAAAPIERLRQLAAVEGLRLDAAQADLDSYRIGSDYDCIVAIGLLMFFRRERVQVLLEQIQAQVRPGGCAIVNVLTEGTSFLDMFLPGNYTLFGRDELERRFAAAGWRILLARHDSFPAPRDTLKEFSTVIAERR